MTDQQIVKQWIHDIKEYALPLEQRVCFSEDVFLRIFDSYGVKLSSKHFTINKSNIRALILALEKVLLKMAVIEESSNLTILPLNHDKNILPRQQVEHEPQSA